jgi:hypothetical protein
MNVFVKVFYHLPPMFTVYEDMNEAGAGRAFYRTAMLASGVRIHVFVNRLLYAVLLLSISR